MALFSFYVLILAHLMGLACSGHATIKTISLGKELASHSFSSVPSMFGLKNVPPSSKVSIL